ncbi:hypothetical protein HHJ44_11730 [Escherichia coli]|nr:hypothetical protein HHJ44_11730 [Escherichia coli]
MSKYSPVIQTISEQNINNNVNQCLKQCTCNDRIDGFYWSIIKQSTGSLQ